MLIPKPAQLTAYRKLERRETLGEFINHLTRLITALQKIHPIFATLYEMGRRTPAPVAADLSDLIPILRKRSFDKRDEYSDIGEDGLPTLNSTRSVSYRSYLSSNPKENKVACATKADIEISTGIPGVADSMARVMFPLEGAPEFYELDFQKKIIQKMIEIYTPDSVLLEQFDLQQKVRDETTGIYHCGTVTYFANKDVGDALPEDIERESFCGGVLVIISRNQPDPDNATQILDIHRVQNAVKQSGLTEFV